MSHQALAMNRRELFRIFNVSFKEWLDDGAVLRAAALTFFIILPLPTLLLIVTTIFALFLGQAQAIQILVQQIAAVTGPAVAELFNQLISSTESPFTSFWTTLVVIGFSIGGAIGAFSVLRDTMDCIWEVDLPKQVPLWKRIREKIVPFGVVSSLGLIIIAWTAITRTLFNAILAFSFNEVLTLIALAVAQVMLSFVVSTLLLALIFKLIPQAKVHWQDVTLAAIATGIAFTATNYAFGSYIQTFTITTVGGAAGSLLILLLWIFVLNQIVFFGAEVSKVYSVTVGKHAKLDLPKPIEKAVEPIKKAEEKFEDMTKEDVIKTGESTIKTEQKDLNSNHSPDAPKHNQKKREQTKSTKDNKEEFTKQ
jgi:membrane protein